MKTCNGKATKVTTLSFIWVMNFCIVMYCTFAILYTVLCFRRPSWPWCRPPPRTRPRTVTRLSSWSTSVPPPRTSTWKPWVWMGFMLLYQPLMVACFSGGECAAGAGGAGPRPAALPQLAARPPRPAWCWPRSWWWYHQGREPGQPGPALQGGGEGEDGVLHQPRIIIVQLHYVMWYYTLIRLWKQCIEKRRHLKWLIICRNLSNKLTLWYEMCLMFITNRNPLRLKF